MNMLTRHGFDRDATFVIELDAPFGPCRVSSELGNRRGFVVPRWSLAPEARFWSNVEFTDGCWMWKGAVAWNGYGASTTLRSIIGHPHRIAYIFCVGPIPRGLDLDHLCHSNDGTCEGGVQCPHRLCVRPDHLETVSRRTNLLRGQTVTARNAGVTECPRGHEYTPENTQIQVRRGRPTRKCAECHRAWARARNQRAAARV